MNEDDDLLRELAARSRQEEAAWQATLARLGLSDALLERYAAQQLTTDEHGELQALAARDAEAARILSAYAPLSDESRAAVLDRVHSLTDTSEHAPEQGTSIRQRDESATIAPFSPTARRSRRVLRPLLAIPAALAAGLIVALLLPTLLTQPPSDTLPAYVLSVSGMTAQLRAAPTDTVQVRVTNDAPVALTLAPGNALQLLMTPTTQTGEAVQARLYLQSPGDGSITPLALDPALVRTAASGAIRIEARVGEEILLPAGKSRMLVVVGQANAMPQAQRLTTLLGERGGVDGGAWQAFALDLELSE